MPRNTGQGSNLQGASIRPTCWSWGVFRRGRRQLELTWGTRILVAAIWELLLPGGYWCWQASFPCSIVLGLSPAQQPVYTTTATCQAMQVARQGHWSVDEQAGPLKTPGTHSFPRTQRFTPESPDLATHTSVHVLSHFSRVGLFANLWTAAHQAPLSRSIL